jgi:hypothetical protein
VELKNALRIVNAIVIIVIAEETAQVNVVVLAIKNAQEIVVVDVINVCLVEKDIAKEVKNVL